jgi:putative methanogenesis marker protein 6
VTEYTPTHAGAVTKYMVVESFEVTPADLALRAYEISQGVMIKETCFGIVINGDEKEVDRIITELRKLDPERCRANLGGARPGYNGMEYEMTIIPYVSHGLEELKNNDEKTIPAPENPLEHQFLDIYKLKKLIDAQEP